MARTGTTVWRKSGRCDSHQCVEVADADNGGMHVRDNKNPDGPVLTFGRGAWRGFVDGLKGSTLSA